MDVPAKLNVTVTPPTARPTLVYSSSDESVATIDQNGNITVKAVGTVELTVSTEDAVFSSSITITCRDTWTVTVALLAATVTGWDNYIIRVRGWYHPLTRIIF